MRISHWSSDVCSSDLYEEIFDAEPQSSAPLRGIANISGGMSLRENSAGPIFISRPNAGGRWFSGGRQGGIDEGHHIYNLTQPGRQRVVSGKRVEERVRLGGRRTLKKKKTQAQTK